MASHKRKRPKNRRAGCLWCKPWKMNGFSRRTRPDGERYSDHRRRRAAELAIADFRTRGPGMKPGRNAV